MAADHREFFREATLRICGDLDIKKAMVRFLQYLQEFMLADRIVLERYNEELGATRVVVHPTPKPYYENDPSQHPGARELPAFHK